MPQDGSWRGPLIFSAILAAPGIWANYAVIRSTGTISYGQDAGMLAWGLMFMGVPALLGFAISSILAITAIRRDSIAGIVCFTTAATVNAVYPLLALLLPIRF